MSEKVFKSVGGGTGIEFVRPSQLLQDGFTGIILEGVYVGPVPNRMDDTKNDFKFEREDGKPVIINNAGSLAYKLGKVVPGTLVQVVYNGQTKIKKGKMAGKMAHDFDVLVAEE